MRKARVTAFVSASFFLLSIPGRSPRANASDVQLMSGDLVAVLSSQTGQVKSLSERNGGRWLSQSEDRYDLEDKRSEESKDVVLSSKTGNDRITFECENRELGLRLTKSYLLRDSILEKKVTCLGTKPDKALLKVSSRSLFDEGFYNKGYYYTPIDDGYKVQTVPFLPSGDVTLASPWTISTGALVFYSPEKNRVFTHYRYKINGGYCYGESNGISSEYVPGGAVTALGQDFINNTTALTLESRYALLRGDPRAFHKHLLGQPPYTEYRNARVPGWFKHVRMFLSDGMKGAGRGLMEDPEAVAKDITSFLKLIPEDDYLMVFFNHWSTSGDYPYQGSFRYYRYDPADWSKPVSVERLKEKIRWLRSFSSRIKVGGYFFFTPAAGTPPYEQHKDWFIYDKNNEIVPAGDGLGATGWPDFSGPYRDYFLDQMKHAITDLGFDWIHMDTGINDFVNYRTKRVVQSWEIAKLYDDLAKFCVEHDAAMVQNVAWTTALWAQGSYLECQQPDRWEKRDWRILGASGYANALYRTHHPDTWVNLVYGTAGMYGIRNAYSGMRGWIRNGMNWWPYTSMSLARENVIDELLDTKASEVEVSPCWWKLETDKLEAEALERGSSFVVPVLLHGDRGGEHQLSLRTSDLKLRQKRYTFGLDLKVASPDPVNVFKPVPWTEDYVTLTGFTVSTAVGQTYSHRMKLEPLTNYYHTITQTPAWVYSVKGQRAALLLPENRGVKINGSAPVGADSYRLSVENVNPTARILAFIPSEWRDVTVRVNGQKAPAQIVRVMSERCLLLEVGNGKASVVVSESRSPLGRRKHSETAYMNPRSEVWRENAERVFYEGLQHRAYEENGTSCLALTGTGAAQFPMLPAQEGSGFSLKVKGQNTGGRLQVVLNAGDVWRYDIKDDFTGWKEFEVSREQLSTNGKDRKWDKTTNVTLISYPVGEREVHVADLHLLRARKGDFPQQASVKKRLVAFRTKIPPVMNGSLDQPCWKSAKVATDFHAMGSDRISDSKTKVRVCYDDTNLYVLFENLESIDSLGKQQPRDSEIWNIDHLELYVDPFRDGMSYFHLLVDPAGTIEDLRATRTSRSHQWDGDFEVKTFLNWKASWIAQLKIPFKTFERTPATGQVWGINFARKDMSGEWSNWASTGEWLDPSGFGEIEFAEEVGNQVKSPRADPDVLFYASMDGTPVPEVHRGAGTWEASPGLQFSEGRRGRALRVGHNDWVHYPAKDHVDLQEGTIRFWVKPINWNHNQQLFHHFLSLQSSTTTLPKDTRPFNLLIYKFWEWDALLVYGMQQLLEGGGLFEVPMNDTWVPGKWHQIAFTWDQQGQKLFLDGEGVSRKYNGKAPDVLAAETIQVGGPYFVKNEALTALGELCIYKRSLSGTEIKQLYQEGPTAGAVKR